MRVGFVTVWFERGQAYVTRTLRDAVARQHETFIFARTAGVFGEANLETTGYWNVPNLTPHADYDISGAVLKDWIRRNQLDAVIFNEEYDWELVGAAKTAGAKAITYLDFYKEDWKPLLAIYDGVLCSTKRTHQLVRDVGNAEYVGWSVDIELFRPATAAPKFTFFHNAGWLGISCRKMTPAAIIAFDAISRHLPDLSLLIHSQAPLEKLPREAARIARSNPKIDYRVETLPAPGLYHEGRILLFPSKLEGLGLPLLEGLACGVPALIAEAPPMNEFIQPGQTGLTIQVARSLQRKDNVAFPETIIDVSDLALKMAGLGLEPELTAEMGHNARRFAETELHPIAFSERVNRALEQFGKGKR